jgi:acetyl-CoA carboxylase carboxyltransferase component/acetyl/propionyl-CoA carboxylase alpha subunit
MEDLAGRRLLVANRGEVAVRVLRTGRELGLRTTAVVAADEPDAAHGGIADEVVRLRAEGVAAYRDVEGVLEAAGLAPDDLVHPGWGFASEDPAFPRACAARGAVFVGPSAAALERFGDKVASRALAERLGVPVTRGTAADVGPDTVRALMAELGETGAVAVKAVAGGGGRGMRIVHDRERVEEAVEACRGEARAAFGDPRLYAEEVVTRARHVEVQVVADADGVVAVLGDRDCSLQRRRQKLLEVAPAPGLPSPVRQRLWDDARRLVGAVGLTGLATVEFLIDLDRLEQPGADGGVHTAGVHRFLEVNPRLQVEHTVTEQLLGRDLVAVQVRLAAGARLEALGIEDLDAQEAAATGTRIHAVQARVAAERLGADGTVTPTVGRVERLVLPGGPGVRVDTHLREGTRIGSRYDPLLVKVVAQGAEPGLASALRRLGHAIEGLALEGVETNAPLLWAIASHPEVVAGGATTRFVERHLDELLGAARRHPASGVASVAAATDGGEEGRPTPQGGEAVDLPEIGEGQRLVTAPLAGTVVEIATVGDEVAGGRALVLVEAMKMEHVVAAETSVRVARALVGVGDEVAADTPLLVLEPLSAGGAATAEDARVDLDRIRPELEELRRRRHLLTDTARPEAVERRHASGRRTARENLEDLCDPGSFVEYGGFAVAAQRSRRSLEELQRRTQADGLIGGLARVNGDDVPDDRAQTVVLSYDYMVLAGTQGMFGHKKKDRLLDVAGRLRRPVVFFTEGGGGRPGDTDVPMVAGLDTVAFALWAGLSGVVPRIGIANGRCFAGNAAILGACDVVIATPEATIGMGGPAMIEGGGLGRVTPEEVGPAEMQADNGVVDVLAEDDADAVRLAKQALGYFQGAVEAWECADQRRLRHVVPEERLRVYDVREAVELLADTGSVLELRPRFATGMVTALARLEGRPVGIVANNPVELAGAITSDGADKAARFLQLCEAFDLPVLFLCDTPGIMVGPEAEATGLVRHASRLFLAGAHLTVPFVTLVLRKGYGLGAQAMAGGSFHAPLLTASWPTGEFGGMGLEGAVRLALRRELEAIEDPDERRRTYEEAVAWAYEQGKALSMASYLEIDDVIDPAESRRVVLTVLRSAPAPAPRRGRKAGYVDAW